MIFFSCVSLDLVITHSFVPYRSHGACSTLALRYYLIPVIITGTAPAILFISLPPRLHLLSYIIIHPPLYLYFPGFVVYGIL